MISPSQFVQAQIRAGLTQEQISGLIDRFYTGTEHEEATNELFSEKALGALSQRSTITMGDRQLREESRDVLDALYELTQFRPQIFQRGGHLVRIVVDEKGNPYIDKMDEAGLRGICSRCSDFVRVSKLGDRTEIAPPLDVIRDILSLKQWEFPSLLAITSTPIIHTDGGILVQPGYDPDTALYYYSDLRVPDVPAEPTQNDVRTAAELLKEVLYDFPFDSAGSRANAVAALITPVIRPLIDGIVPLAVFDKPQAGTGASLLCDLVALIATGTPAGMMSGYKDDVEWRKIITTTLLRGHTVVVIDNVDGELYAGSLATLLTMRIWRDRVLGRNEEVRLPNIACWLANGNNVKLKGDLPRRAYWIRLDAQEAQPWLRSPETFRHPNLMSWVKDHRGEILAAILTLARAWLLAGKPAPLHPVITIGNYEDWCSTVGSLLEYVGIHGFLGNLHEMYSVTDAETPAWEGFLQEWKSIFGNTQMTVAKIAQKAREDVAFAEVVPDSLGAVEDKGFNHRLGRALAKRLGMRFRNGLVIEKGQEKQHATAWRVVEAEDRKLTEFSFKCEFRELPAINLPAEEEAEKTKVELAEENSQNSPPTTKRGEFSCRANTDGLIELWESLGRPIIHLGPGEKCEDLRRLLDNANVLPRHLETVLNWAEQEGWQSPEQEP